MIALTLQAAQARLRHPERGCGVSGLVRITVNGSFTATHICAEPEAHEHTWDVAATFEVAPRTDARLYRAELDTLLANWHGKQLPPELEWSEDISRAVCLLVNCVGAVVSRPSERIAVEWVS